MRSSFAAGDGHWIVAGGGDWAGLTADSALATVRNVPKIVPNLPISAVL